MNRCQTCLKHEKGKRAKGSTEADPQTARYKARPTKTAASSRKTDQHNSKAWVAPACNAREKVRSTRELKLRVTVTVRVKETRRERRGSRTHQRCRTNRRTTPWQEAAMSAVTARVDAAQRLTQWCWSGIENHRRTAAARNLSDQSSQSAEHVVVNYTNEEPEHLPRANDHEGRNAE